MAGKNITLKISLKSELDKKRKLSDKAINDTAKEARYFWAGYNQAIQELQQRFFNT